MNTSFYWRDYPRTKPRRPGMYLVTYELPFTEGPEVDVDTWDGVDWGYMNGISAWMPCPLPYKKSDTPNYG